MPDDPTIAAPATRPSRFDRSRVKWEKAKAEKAEKVSTRKPAGRPRRLRKLSPAQNKIAGEVLSGELVPRDVDVIARAINDDSRSHAAAIREARKKLVKRADYYVDLHQRAAEIALQCGEVGEARKAAEFALEKMSIKDADGSTVRIIDAPAGDTSARGNVQIGIVLGGLPAREK